MHAHFSDGLVLDKVVARHNNTERFLTNQAAGGIKVTSSRHIVLRDGDVSNNYGDGAWFDECVWDSKALRTAFRQNTRYGLEVEISDQGLVAGNLFLENDAAGLEILDTSDIAVWNNTFVRNLEAFKILEGPREYSTWTGRGRDSRNLNDPNMSWTVKGIVLRNNVVTGGKSDTRMYLNVDDASKLRGASDMVDADYDVYYRPVAGTPTWLVAWSEWPTRMRVFNTKAEFTTATGRESHGYGVDGGSDPLLFDAAAGRYTLGSTSPFKGKGAALPSDVATALGKTAGVAVDPGILG
jgi:hypothetical protein